MGENRTYVQPFGWLLTAIIAVSNCEDALWRESEETDWDSRQGAIETSNELAQQESELQVLDAEFSDDLTTEEYAKKMKKRQEIEEKHTKNLMVIQMNYKMKEDHHQKRQTQLETTLEEQRTEMQTAKELVQAMDCSYNF